MTLFFKVCLLLALGGFAFGDARADVTRVIYPADEVPDDPRHRDLIELLDTALARTVPKYGAYELRASDARMNEARYLKELRRGGAVNVAWSSTSVSKERDFAVIRIPLRKGLLGYRVMLIAKDRQKDFSAVRSIDDLKRFSIGQGTGWGDVDLYRADGFYVQTAEYASLFKMVAAGRFDMFPRGVCEVMHEFNTYRQRVPELAIEDDLLIYYPWPFYFFFNTKDAVLRERVEAGLRAMIRDRSFDAIFWKYHGEAIAQLNLKGRRVMKIDNPGLPPETPLSDKSLWYDPLTQ